MKKTNKTMIINKKIGLRLLLVLIFALLIAALAGCSADGAPTEFTEICALAPIVVRGAQQPLPDIFLQSAEGAIAASYADFWFLAEHVYVYGGNILIKPDAPSYFAEDMVITYKLNPVLQLTVSVEKEYIKPQSVTISGINGKLTCTPGGEMQLVYSVFPAEASVTKVPLTVTNGEGAVWDYDILWVSESAQSGAAIEVSAVLDGEVLGKTEIQIKSRTPIDTAAKLLAIKANPNDDYIIETDIYLTSEDMLQLPIPKLYGSLDGNGKSIYNFNMTVPQRTYFTKTGFGLFAELYGIVYRLNLPYAVIDSAVSHKGGLVCAGAIAGLNFGKVESCNATGSFALHRNHSALGGIVGHNMGTIMRCSFGTEEDLDNFIYGNGDTGGIVGLNGGTIAYCNVYNTKISFYAAGISRGIGGIAGSAYIGGIYFSGAINVEVAYVGGWADYLMPSMGIIVGYMENSQLFYVSHIDSWVNTALLTEAQAVNCATGVWGERGLSVNTEVR